MITSGQDLSFTSHLEDNEEVSHLFLVWRELRTNWLCQRAQGLRNVDSFAREVPGSSDSQEAWQRENKKQGGSTFDFIRLLLVLQLFLNLLWLRWHCWKEGESFFIWVIPAVKYIWREWVYKAISEIIGKDTPLSHEGYEWVTRGSSL